MAEDGRERELRDELARLDAEMADGERSANDLAAKARRRAEIASELDRLGIEAPEGGKPATYLKPE